MGRIVGAAARAGNIFVFELLPNEDVRAVFVRGGSGRRTRGNGGAARQHIHGILPAGIDREFNLGMVRLPDGSIRESDLNPVAPVRGLDLAAQGRRYAHRDVCRGRGHTRIGIRVGQAFAAIAGISVDIGATGLTRSNCASANGAGPSRNPACAGVLRGTGHIGIRFIKLSVAIVIEVVANLGCGIEIAVAHESTARARRRSRRTNAGLTRRARNSTAGIAVVDAAIAIVIESVAHFRARILISIAHEHTHRARRRTGGTNARLARVACYAAARVAVISRPVAIVIEAIASFGRRKHRLRTNDRPGRTSGDAGAAQSRQTVITRHTAAGIAFIDGAVAIVVDAVTDLGGGVVVAIADNRAGRTGRRSSRANTLLTGIASDAAARIAVVDGTIAIVIQAVTDFR